MTPQSYRFHSKKGPLMGHITTIHLPPMDRTSWKSGGDYGTDIGPDVQRSISVVDFMHIVYDIPPKLFCFHTIGLGQPFPNFHVRYDRSLQSRHASKNLPTQITSNRVTIPLFTVCYGWSITRPIKAWLEGQRRWNLQGKHVMRRSF